MKRGSSLAGWWCIAHRISLGMGACINQIMGTMVTLVQSLSQTFNGISMQSAQKLVDGINELLPFMTVDEQHDIGKLRRMGKYVAIRWSSFLSAVTRVARLIKPTIIVLKITDKTEVLRQLRKAEPLLLFVVDFDAYFEPLLRRVQFVNRPWASASGLYSSPTLPPFPASVFKQKHGSINSMTMYEC